MRKKLMTLATVIATVALAGSLLAQQGRGPAAWAGPMSGTGPQVDPAKITNVTGDVVKLTGGPGQGMPTLVLNVGGKEESYVLGPYRYLAAQKFAPAAHDRVELKLWACTGCPEGVVVADVKNVTQGTMLPLRAADGSPLFAGPGGPGGPRGRGAGCCGRGAGPGTGPGWGPNPNCPYR